MLAKQEDVRASSRKLDHHASMRIDDQSPTFPLFSLRFPVTFSDHPPSEKPLCFSRNRLHRSLLDPALFRKRLSLGGLEWCFLYVSLMLYSANDRV